MKIEQNPKTELMNSFEDLVKKTNGDMQNIRLKKPQISNKQK